ncbi:MAG: hypothetical protein M1829_003490 [Trizodia sp. TS-e1964]|nr:MAG: hypothetical protein M1829_003490 [Trizodia sp. TS-e1964]
MERHQLPEIPDMQASSDAISHNSFCTELYFFYGSLQAPARLMSVLLSDPPLLRPAKLFGYKIMLWGPYPAIVEAEPDKVINGMSYEVQSADHRQLLEFYETNNYKNDTCLIQLEDGTKTVGRTFTWNGDMSMLKEGVFHLKEWQMKENIL